MKSKQKTPGQQNSPASVLPLTTKLKKATRKNEVVSYQNMASSLQKSKK